MWRVKQLNHHAFATKIVPNDYKMKQKIDIVNAKDRYRKIVIFKY